MKATNIAGAFILSAWTLGTVAVVWAQQAPAAGGVPESDRKLMVAAASGGLAEVQMGRLALQKSSDESVKRHAQHMIDDHSKNNDELKSIASSKGVTLPTAPEGKDKALVDKLSGLDGKKFDQAYIREGGVKAHKDMVALLRTAKQQGKSPELKQYAEKTLPTVQEHLRESEQMASGKDDAAMRGMNHDADSKQPH